MRNLQIKLISLLMSLMIGLQSVHVFAEDTYTLSFRDADIKEIIKYVADNTGYTVIIDPKVKGKVQLISTQPVTKQELYDLFLAVLATHGYAAVKTGNVLRIIPDKEARTSPVPVIQGNSSQANPEFVTQIIELENVSAVKLIPVLRPLVPQQGHMAAYADTNAIIISATADVVDKIIKVIASVDRSTHSEAEIIRLKHASAEETVKILTKVLNPKGGGDKSPVEDRVTLVADTRSNSIVVSGTQQARMRVRALVAELDTPLDSVGNARVFFLHYANAKELAPVLAKVSQSMANLDAGGQNKAAANAAATIEADEATNSLIITARAEVMEGLENIIRSLDIPRAQVLVEAIIVEVTQDDGKALGFDWLAASEHGGFGGSNHTAGLLQSLAAGAFDDDTDDAITGTAAAISQVQGGTWGAADFDTNGTSFAAIITALETNGEANILSTPSLMTLDNNEASIVVGQEVPFVTGSYTSTGDSGSSSSSPGNPFQTIDRENVGITLQVTPHVNEGGLITLNILQEVSGLAGTTSGLSTADVVTNERRIETTVTAQDGEIIVLGGLIRDEVQETVSKVPILGDLPLIGRLFRTASTDVKKTNLMVFIRPTVILNSATSLQASRESYEQVRGVQLYKKARGVDLFDEEVIPILPEWEEQIQRIEELQQEAGANP